jgi:hypothetical protein
MTGAADGGKYVVASESMCAFEVPVVEGVAAPTRETMAAHLCLDMLKKSPHLKILFELRYEAIGNRLNSGMPSIFLTEPVRITKDEVVQLSWK